MPTLTVEYTTEEERLILERAVAFVAEMRRLACTAPDGRVLDVCEAHALDGGRDLLRAVLQQAVHQRQLDSEKRGAPHGAAPADASGDTRANTAVSS
jgi:hypothetical protein